MACTYCFYLEKAELFDKSRMHRMSKDILKETIRQVMMQGAEEVSFGWQGGEPTLMGLPFFEKAVEFQKQYGRHQTVGNGLQTNGLLIDEAWADFLREYRFLVGLSIDGPKHVHDHYRRLTGGQPTWNKVVDKAKLLLDAGVEVNGLSVVNDYSVRFAEEIYDFHKSIGLHHMQFIPCVETDPEDDDRMASYSVSAEDYSRFLVTLFDLWLGDFVNGQLTTSIRYFESVFYTYVGLIPPMCTLFKECGNYVVVEHNGDVYACDFFVETEWRLGNVTEDRLIDFLNSPRQKAFGKQKSRLPNACKECQWLEHCRGGCTKDRLHNPEDRRQTYFCESYKVFFEHADATLREIADVWKTEHGIDGRSLESQEYERSRKAGRNDPCPCGSGKKFKHCCG
jgi:uncharacterized protein